MKHALLMRNVVLQTIVGMHRKKIEWKLHLLRDACLFTHKKMVHHSDGILLI